MKIQRNLTTLILIIFLSSLAFSQEAISYEKKEKPAKIGETETAKQPPWVTNRVNEISKQRAKQTIERKKRSRIVGIGFTKDQILHNFGKPKGINRTVLGFVTMEQWVYGVINPGRLMIYFRDGLVYAWQD